MPDAEPTMLTADFDYHLPPELIAQHPAARRDGSRMLVLARDGEGVSHRLFSDFPALLRPGDVLVINDTRVIPARLLGRKPTGAEVEIFLLNPLAGDLWRCLVNPGRKLRPGDRVLFGETMAAEIVDRHADGSRSVRFAHDGDFQTALEKVGHIPLPPYIHRAGDEPEDRERYQTVYAAQPGAVAAPTAGLHFTPELLAAVEARGARLARITLHVGIGTFRPVTAELAEEHRMEAERYEISPEAAALITGARPGGRIFAVGTTSVRTLESAWDDEINGIRAGSAWTSLYIRPGYAFRAVDALLTNFHLPKSTLLMLVSAFAGRERVLAAYAEAVREGYRFYSYGDCMVIV
jgi:S-adenosylmethionine:tRNA ribosyltransferase-isomerase